MSDTTPAAHVLCMGCAVMDHIFAVPELPSAALKYRARQFRAVGGGNAATAAVAISRLGGQASLIARLGEDYLADAIIGELNGYGVDCRHAHRFAGHTSSISAIMIDPQGERMIVNHFDWSISAVPDWLPALPERTGAVMADAQWLEGVLEMFARARAAGVPTILDADMPSCAPELIEASSIAAFSAPGLQAATGEAEIVPGLRAAARFGSGVIMATDGANGVYWLEQGRLWHFPAYRVTVADTLGAGDVFHGALALAVAEGQSTAAAVAFASATAAIKVTRFGGRAGTPARTEVESLMREQTLAVQALA